MWRTKKEAVRTVFNPRNYIRPGLNEDDITEIKEAFDALDSMKAGKVEPQQLIDLMESAGFDLSKQLVISRLMTATAETDYELSFDDFIDKLSIKDTVTRENLERIFDMFDVDKDGEITREGLGKILSEIGVELSAAEIERMIKVADSNNDGRVSVDDFYSIITRRIYA
jgi:Ca2+-binding EF-hand superfamily protein